MRDKKYFNVIKKYYIWAVFNKGYFAFLVLRCIMKNEKKFLWIALCVVLLSSASWAGKFINNLEMRMGGSGVYKMLSNGYTVVKKADNPADLQEDAGIGVYVYMGYTKTDSVKWISSSTGVYELPITNIVVLDFGTNKDPAGNIKISNAMYKKLAILDVNGGIKSVDISNNKHEEHHLYIYYTKDYIDGKAVTELKVSSSASTSNGYETVKDKNSNLMNLNQYSSKNGRPNVYLQIKRESIPKVGFVQKPKLYNSTNRTSQDYLIYEKYRSQNLLERGTYESTEVSAAYYKKEGGEWSSSSVPQGKMVGTYKVYYKLESKIRTKADLLDSGIVEIHKIPVTTSRYNYSYRVVYNGVASSFYEGDRLKIEWNDVCSNSSRNVNFYLDNGKTFYGNDGIILTEIGTYKINKVYLPETDYCEAGYLNNFYEFINVGKSQVVFNTNGGLPKPETIEGKVGDPVTMPKNPTKDGYVFVKWDPSVPSTIPRGTTTINAIWNKIYTITFDTDGGSSIASVSGVKGTKITAPQDPIKKDYVFLGWNAEIPATMPENDLTIKALWQYNRVKVNLPELMEVVSGDVAEDGTYAKGSTITVRAKTGYVVHGDLKYNGEVIESKDGAYILKVADQEASVEVTEIRESYGAIQVALDHSVAYIDRKSSAFTDVPEAIDVDAVEFVQAFKRGVTTTIVLPFSIDMAYVNGGIFCKFIGVGGSGNNMSVRLMFVSTQLEANTPYVYVPIKDELTFDVPAGTKFSIKTEETAVEFGNWQFKSIYSLRNWRTGEGDHGRAYAFIASKDGSDGVAGKFQKIGNNNSMPPMRGYLVYETAPQAIRSAFDGAKYEPAVVATLPDEIGVEIVSEEDKTLAVGKINMVTGELKIDRWFDVTGKLLKGKPTTKGAYYHNGKKVIIK